MQKRDYLVWHNPLLVIIDAFILANLVMMLFLAPIIFTEEVIAGDMTTVDALLDPGFILFSLIIQDGILVWLVWHQVVRRRVIPLSEMGISREQLFNTPRTAKLAIMGLAVGLALFTISLLIESAQSSVGFEPSSEGVMGPISGDLRGYLLWLVSGCIIAPLSEEFFFRGYAFYAFEKREGLIFAVAASAVGFALVHLNIYALLPIFVAGVGLALVYHYSGSLVPAIIAHAVNNFIAITLMYIGFY